MTTTLTCSGLISHKPRSSCCGHCWFVVHILLWHLACISGMPLFADWQLPPGGGSGTLMDLATMNALHACCEMVDHLLKWLHGWFVDMHLACMYVASTWLASVTCMGMCMAVHMLLWHRASFADGLGWGLAPCNFA